MRSLLEVLESVSKRRDDRTLASLRVECDSVLRTAQATLAKRLRQIVMEYELLDMDDVDDRAYFRDFLMAPTSGYDNRPCCAQAACIHTKDTIDATCAWMLRDNMGVDPEILYEIFAAS